MTHPNPYPTCIFCGEKANSREHAIPAWIARRFKIKGLMLGGISTTNIQNPRRRPVSFANHRARILCKECNTFFKHLEDQVADTVEWMARGRPLQLDTEQLALLGCWGAKTGIALIAAEREFRELVPIEHRRSIREKEIPHDNCWVGYASWGGKIHKFVGEQSFVLADNSSYRAYAAVLTFEQLAFKLFGLFDPIPGHKIGRSTQSFRQVWPPIDLQMGWPLFPAAQQGNLQGLCEFAPLTPFP